MKTIFIENDLDAFSNRFRNISVIDLILVKLIAEMTGPKGPPDNVGESDGTDDAVFLSLLENPQPEAAPGICFGQILFEIRLLILL